MTRKQLRRTDEFRKAKLIGLLGCGSTPGITNVMAARMARDFDTIESVGIYDAGHDPTLNEDSFIPPFSIRTMLDEYEMGAPILASGRIKELPACSVPEEMEFPAPIGRVTAVAVIHSEAATLPAFLKSQGLRDLVFKIVYPESVKRQLRLLSGMGFSADRPVPVNGKAVSPRRFVTAMAAQAALAPASQPGDFEVLRVIMRGVRAGLRIERTLDCHIRPTALLSAGSIGVGFAGAIGASLLGARRTILGAGLGAPETVIDPDVFLTELGRRKTFSFYETVSRPLAMSTKTEMEVS